MSFNLHFGLAGCLAVALQFLPGNAHGYDGGASMWIGAGPPLLIHDLNQRMLQNAASQIGKPGQPAAQPPKAAPAQAPLRAADSATIERSLKRLAQAYPTQQQPAALGLFKKLLAGYAQIEKQFDLPPHDMGAAVAAFVAGSYMAYNNAEFPDESFKPLVRQMQQILANEPASTTAAPADIQEAHTQLAVLGMFMASTQMALRSSPNEQAALNMRNAAKDYVAQFLKVDISRMHLTPQGLVLR